MPRGWVKPHSKVTSLARQVLTLLPSFTPSHYYYSTTTTVSNSPELYVYTTSYNTSTTPPTSTIPIPYYDFPRAKTPIFQYEFRSINRSLGFPSPLFYIYQCNSTVREISPSVHACCSDCQVQHAQPCLHAQPNEILHKKVTAKCYVMKIFSVPYTLSNHENKNLVCMLKFKHPPLLIITCQSKLSTGRLRPWHDCPKTSYRRRKVTLAIPPSRKGSSSKYICSKTRYKRHTTLSMLAVKVELERTITRTRPSRLTRDRKYWLRPWHDCSKTSYRRNKSKNHDSKTDTWCKVSCSSQAHTPMNPTVISSLTKYKSNKTPQASAGREPAPHSYEAVISPTIPLDHTASHRIVDPNTYTAEAVPITTKNKLLILSGPQNNKWRKYKICQACRDSARNNTNHSINTNDHKLTSLLTELVTRPLR